MSRCYNTEQFAFLLYTFYIQNKCALNPHHWFVSWNYPSGVFLLCHLLTHKIKVPLILENTQKHCLNLIISGYNSEAEFNSNHSFIAEVARVRKQNKIEPRLGSNWERTTLDTQRTARGKMWQRTEANWGDKFTGGDLGLHRN